MAIRKHGLLSIDGKKSRREPAQGGAASKWETGGGNKRPTGMNEMILELRFKILLENYQKSRQGRLLGGK